jgi:hypothetical protein
VGLHILRSYKTGQVEQQKFWQETLGYGSCQFDMHIYSVDIAYGDDGLGLKYTR